LGIITLPLANVFGKVAAPNGVTPVPEAEVVIRNNDWSFSYFNRTDQEGNFQFSAPEGDYLLEARPDWNSNLPYSSSVPMEVHVGPEGLTGLMLQLTNPLVVGHVYDIDGTTPVQHAPVQIHTPDWSQNAFAMTDEDGKFMFGGLPEGEYLIEVQKPKEGNYAGFGAVADVTLNGGLLDVEITLEEPAVTVTVLMPGGLAPAINAHVNIHNNTISKA